MKKGYWISLYLKVDNQENLKICRTVTPIIKSLRKPFVRGGKYQTFDENLLDSCVGISQLRKQ